MVASRKWKIVIIALLLIILLLFAAGYLYSQYAGEWASSTILDVPPNSTFIQDYRYEQYGYNNHLTLYAAQGTLQDVRDWYNEKIAMSPIANKLSDEDSRYCSLSIGVEDVPQYRLLFTAAFVSLNPNLRRYDTIPACFSVCIYNDLPNDDYPVLMDTTLILPENSSIVVLNTCWPDW